MGNNSGHTDSSDDESAIIKFPNQTTWLNLKNKSFEEKLDMWYNLQTNRYIKNQPLHGTNINYSLRNIRIIGTLDQVMQFWKININQLGTVYSHGTLCEQVIFQPFSDIEFITKDAVLRSQACHLGTAGTIIPLTQATDVEQLTTEETTQLCSFSFAGLFVKCRVINVIDGDTLHVVIFVPLHELGATRAVGPKGTARVGALLQNESMETRSYWTSSKESSTNTKTGFFALVKIRMYGYDAQEKDTHEGKLAKQLFAEKIASLNNIVWCQFVEINIAQEKYDRILGVLFEDQAQTQPLNNFLLKKEKELNVHLVNPYLGGTKQTFD